MSLRFITKHLYPNYDKLRDFDRVLANHVEPALRITDPKSRFNALCGVNRTNILITSQSNYFWIFQLPDGKLDEMCAEWKGKFQSVAMIEEAGQIRARGGYSHKTGTGPPVLVDAAKRVQLLANTSRNKDLFEGLQRIKYRYQEMAAAAHKTFFASLKTDFATLTSKLDDSIHHSAVGMYLTMFEELERTYERATDHGAANELQQEILQGGGLYHLLKSCYKLGRGIAEVVSGVGVVSGVKKLVEGAGNFLNVAGGLIAGIAGKLQGKEADYRRLTSQLGLEAKIKQLKKELMGETQEAFSEQVLGGTDRLIRGANLFKAELEKIEKAIRHSVFWMENWKRDLAQLSKEINLTDTKSYGAVLVNIFQQATDNPINKDESGLKIKEVIEVEAAVKTKMEARRVELSAKIAELRVKVRRMERMLEQDLKILVEHRASIDTRLAIATAQTRSVLADRQFNHQMILANEIAGFDKSKLRKHTDPRPPPLLRTPGAIAARPHRPLDASGIASEVAAVARAGGLKPVTARVIPPAPATAMTSLHAALAERRKRIAVEEEDEDEEINGQEWNE